jgi:hypothetical protein
MRAPVRPRHETGKSTYWNMSPIRPVKCFKAHSVSWNEICQGGVLPDSFKGAVDVLSVGIQGQLFDTHILL